MSVAQASMQSFGQTQSQAGFGFPTPPGQYPPMNGVGNGSFPQQGDQLSQGQSPREPWATKILICSLPRLRLRLPLLRPTVRR